MTALKFKQFAPMRSALLTVTALLLSLAGCSLSPVDPAAAAIGFGDTISDKTLNSIARPPIQVVYRFDDHRYIENNPEPGYNLPCQGELFYVDAALGIRTEVDGNKHGNPEGVFKVVNSPYVIARNDMAVYVSFDQGRTFKSLRPQVSGGSDVVVVGNDIYVGGGGDEGPNGAFLPRQGALWFVIDPAKQEITLKYREQSHESEGDRIRKLARAQFTFPLSQSDYFTCRRDLPRRPSINRERQLLKQQQQNPSTANVN
ncbi:T6SS immunity protein Tli3 family protein [Ralstonia sp. 25C]|uniref:T6SS immunity protein Tli3 family protein n=1 Tax=Ralstonia sp. 25C TaxID=3447363 RepID=UPI003F755EE4